MRSELLRRAECGQHAEIEEAAGPPVESLACPDCPPAVLGDELLHRAHERRRLLERTVDVLGTEHGPTDLQTLLEALRHDQPSSYSSSVTGSSQSTSPREIAMWSM